MSENSTNTKTKKNGWGWVPSLYYAEGLPYVVVMAISVIMYKRMGISNTDIALYTSWLYLPWVIKPLWSPIVDIFKTKRFWIVAMQMLIGAGLAGVALTIPVPNYFQYTLAFFWLMAFSSATHDIAADGFYMLGLTEHEQAWFVGIRSTFYRLASITGQGILVILAGYIESSTGLPPVNISAHAVKAPTEVVVMNPDSIKFDSQNAAEMLVYPKKVEISVNKLDKKKADSVLAFAKNWNLQNGFTKVEEKIEKKATDVGWFENNISNPLSGFLKSHFGKNVQIASNASVSGNLALVYFKYPGKNQKDVSVNFSRETGESLISVVEGGRLEFNEKNANKVAIAVIQLDKKLNQEASAEFTAVSGNVKLAWIVTFGILAALFITFLIYHKFMLPYPAIDKANTIAGNAFKDFLLTFALFFKKRRIVAILFFLLFYRFAEAQLVKLVAPFLLDSREAGGLGLTTGQLGIVYGTIGVAALVVGGILGGIAAAKKGLGFWIWPMAVIIHLPDLAFVYLSQTQTQNIFVIGSAVALEQFGYGFGFTAYMLFMLYVAQGEHKTAHYAITTGFMALGMMIPGMFSGWLQDIIGYQHFFIWVMLSTIPGFLALLLIPYDKNFGKK